MIIRKHCYYEIYWAGLHRVTTCPLIIGGNSQDLQTIVFVYMQGNILQGPKIVFKIVLTISQAAGLHLSKADNSWMILNLMKWDLYVLPLGL